MTIRDLTPEQAVLFKRWSELHPARFEHGLLEMIEEIDSLSRIESSRDVLQNHLHELKGALSVLPPQAAIAQYVTELGVEKPEKLTPVHRAKRIV
jgi:hypothetical protein